MLLDREEIQRAAQHLGIKPVILVSPYGFLILHLVQRPNGEYGTHHQMGSKVQLDGRIGVTAFPVWVDGQGLKRTCLVKHFRVTLAWMPEAYGSGWELEFPAFGAEHEQGIVSSVQQELMEEAGLRLVGDPRRLDAEDDAHPGFALFPGISSHIEQVWHCPVEPTEEAHVEEEEGIIGRVLWTKVELQDAFRKGRVVLDGQPYVTTLAHNLFASHWAELRGIW